MKLFASTLTYELGKRLGIAGAARAFAQTLSGASIRHDVASARVMQRLRDFGDVIVYHGAGTCLPKARSRAAHAALSSDADVWVMIDDDVETDRETLRRLLDVAGVSRVAVLPCVLRGAGVEQHTVNCLWDGELVNVIAGVQTRAVRRAGCGLMVVPRAALTRVVDAFRPGLSFDDDDGARKVAVFSMMLTAQNDRDLWLGEDLAFCERVRAAGIDIVAPLEGVSSHDGAQINLADCAP